MNSSCKLDLELFFESNEKARIAFNAVKQELGHKFEKRSVTTINNNKNVVLVKINGMDSKAVQASMNSYLKLFLLSEKIMEVF